MSNLTNPTYDSVSQLGRVAEQDPLNQQYILETVVDASSQSDATFDYYFNCDGYSFVGMQAAIDGGSGTATLTLEASNETGDPSGLTYQDVTSTIASAASFTADTFELMDVRGISTIHVKIVLSGASADGAWKIDLKKMY